MNLIKWIFVGPLLLALLYVIGITSPLHRYMILSGILKSFQEMDVRIQQALKERENVKKN